MAPRLISRLRQWFSRKQKKVRDLPPEDRPYNPAREKIDRIIRMKKVKITYDQYKKRNIPIWIEYAPPDPSTKSGVQQIVVCASSRKEDLTENQKKYAELMVDVKDKEAEFWANSNKFKEEQGLTEQYQFGTAEQQELHRRLYVPEENRKFAEYQRWWSKKFWEISYLEYKIACESNPHERILLISCSVLFIAWIASCVNRQKACDESYSD